MSQTVLLLFFIVASHTSTGGNAIRQRKAVIARYEAIRLCACVYNSFSPHQYVKLHQFRIILRVLILSLSFFIILSTIHAQQFDLLIKGGHVIDAKNQIDSKMDVAVSNGKVAKVAKSIAASEVKKVIDATGLTYVPTTSETRARLSLLQI